VAIAIGLLACGGLQAQQQIPDSSLEKLRDVLSYVRDHIWDKNDEYWHRGEFNRCIATMRLVTQIDPHDTESYENTSWLMWSDLREADAEAFLREGLANNPNVYDIYFELGMFLYLRTRFEEAIPLFAACLTFADTPPYVRHQLAHAYEQSGDIGDALDTWIEAQAAEPDSEIPRIQIDRIMEGGEPTHVPQNTARAIQQRLREEGQRQ